MKIYAITKGEYSGYHICALTADRAKAEKLRQIYSDDVYEAFIEEFEDGETAEVQIRWSCDADGQNPRVWDYPEPEQVLTNGGGEIYAVHLYAQDAAHATKKAQDLVAQFKAAKAGLI